MFANIKAKLLKVDLRKGGKKVLVFESSVRMSAGELDAIAEMIDQDVNLGLDAQVISYRIQRNAKTNEPVISYKVDDQGVVSEYKVEGEQAEMDLGLPPEKPQIIEEEAEISREVVNEFIMSGLAPRFEDLEYDFSDILNRNASGESYLRIASDLELSSGKLAEVLEEYSKRVAPLAAKWNEWRENRSKAADEVITKSLTKAEEKESDDKDQDQMTTEEAGAAAEEEHDDPEKLEDDESDPMAGVGQDPDNW
ncbi:2-methylcitrate dehydratase [Paenibacillus sp. GCM10027626]|uniref:2-methylcitrate dehydratase n=1 Tax=Paenibacillus sp. GCM10027626 TaxID=3273411 RepID=UPI00362BBF86